MKINKIYLGAAALLLLAGCDDDWNEDNLDGFQEGVEMNDVKNVEYTLTDADYATIADNKTNKSIAEAEGLSDELKALKKNKYFTENISAAKFLPAWLAKNYPTADDKSAVKVTYTKYVGQPEYLSAFEGAKTYEVNTADYTSVWEDKKVQAQYLTPKTVSKLPGILKNAKPEAKAGDVVVANYNYSQTEPSISIGGGDDKVEVAGPWKQIAIPALPTGNSWTWVNAGDIDLSAYAGKKIQIGFTYKSDGTDKGTATYDVTNIKVTSKGAAVFEENFATSLGDCTVEGELPEDLKFVWTNKAYGDKTYARASAFANGTRYAVNATLVTPVIELKGASTLNYDHELNFFKLGADKIADFVTLSVREITEMDKDQASKPYYAPTTSIVEGAKYLFATNVDGVWKTGTPAAVDGKSFGYIKTTDIEGDVIAANEEVNGLVFVFKKTATGYSIQDVANGRFYGADLSTYTSFQMSDKYLEPTEKKSFDWTVEAQADGSMKFTNVLSKKVIQFSSKFKNFNAGEKVEGPLPCLMQYTEAKAMSRAIPQVSYNASDVYTFDGSAWKAFRQEGVNVQVIDPEIYNVIGKDYIGNASEILPTYMEKHNPYAQDGEKVALVYLAKDQEVKAKQLEYTEGAWVITSHVTTTVDQFVRAKGVWNFDPSVTVNLLVKGDLTKLYYQTATDWVWENIDVPAGCTKKGEGYVTSYGNNEYYTGCSAHYSNVDWRAGKAIAQNPKAYEGMSDTEIVDKMKEQFIEVMKPVLEQLHPEAKPVEGVEVLYTLNFIVYTGANENWTVSYKVTAPGQFEYVADSLSKMN